MRVFEKCPDQMNLDEAEAAYRHTLRNVSFDEARSIEQRPEEDAGDGAHRRLCKKLYRRILKLESEE